MSDITRSGFKPRKSLATLAVGAVLVVSSPSAISSDAFNGVVKGVVTGGSSQAASNATITLTHKAKNITRVIRTNERGEYSLRKLPVGKYKMTIEKEGFESVEETSLNVTLGGAIVYNGQIIETGSDIERSSITGSRISRVNLASSTGGIVVTSDEVKKLPVNSGFENIALLAPG